MTPTTTATEALIQCELLPSLRTLTRKAIEADFRLADADARADTHIDLYRVILATATLRLDRALRNVGYRGHEV